MSKLSSLTLVLGLAAGGSAMVAAAAQETAKPAPEVADGPRAVVAEPVVDLGDLTFGTSTSHDFVVRNEGNEPLRIHDARSNCVCAVVDYSEEIAPGAEGKIAVRFDAEIAGGPAAASLVAVTNDPASPQLTFTVKANIRYFIDAKPGFARYTVVQNFEGDSTLTQTLWAIDGKPMRITAVDSPLPFIEASFRQAGAGELMADVPTKEQWKVETRISPQAPVGALTGFLDVHVDHPEQKIVKLPVHGFVRPMFAVTPTVAGGDLTPGAEGVRTSLLVKNFAKEAVVITAAETSVEGISAQVEEEEAGRVYYVILTYSPELPKGNFSGVVRIRTASPKQPLIEVPLRGKIL